jgi:hypothetical protein
MALPKPVAALWDELEAARARVLKEAEGLSQAQANWRPGETDWSIGEIIDHLTIAEIATGKLTSKLTKDAEAAGTLGTFPADLAAFAPLPPMPPGPMEAPPVVRPGHGRAIGELIAAMKAARERSRPSVAKLAIVDPRGLVFKHPLLGDLDLAQWWTLQAAHDGLHLAQIREVRTAPGFPSS